MKVIVQTATDRYIFPEADLIEIENTTSFRMASDDDLPGTIITEHKEEEEDGR